MFFFESTGQYWIAIINIFYDSNLTLILANPQYIKNLPGRQTDVNDAEWIAQLVRCGLIQPSYIPCEAVQQLRFLTRFRKYCNERITLCKNEIHNILHRTNIKVTNYLSNVYGVTGMGLLEIFIDGEAITEETIVPRIYGKIKANAMDLKSKPALLKSFKREYEEVYETEIINTYDDAIKGKYIKSRNVI